MNSSTGSRGRELTVLLSWSTSEPHSTACPDIPPEDHTKRSPRRFITTSFSKLGPREAIRILEEAVCEPGCALIIARRDGLLF